MNNLLSMLETSTAPASEDVHGASADDAIRRTIKIFVNVPAEPFSTDLLFPCGVPINGRVSLVVGDLSKLQADSGCGAVPLAPFVLKQRVVINTPDSGGKPLCIPKPCDSGHNPKSLWKCLTPNDSTVTLSAKHLMIEDLDKKISSDSDGESDERSLPGSGGSVPSGDESPLNDRSLPTAADSGVDESVAEKSRDDAPPWHDMEIKESKEKTSERCVLFSDISSSSEESDEEDSAILGDDLHEETTIPAQDQFYCGICDTGFKSKNTCWMHVWQHVPVVEKIYECEKCGTEFSTAFSHDRHLRTCQAVGTKRKHTCDTCDLVFNTQRELEKHAWTHMSKVTAYCCEYCGWFCLSKAHYDTHLMKSHAEETDIPSVGIEALGNGTDGDVRDHRTCPYCSLHVGESQVSLSKHLVEAHAEIDVFPCLLCSLVFQTKEQQEKHKEESHEIKLETKDSKQFYVCSVCGKLVSASLYVFNNHMRSHRNPGGARFLCSECGASLATLGGFRNHMATHSEDRPHECPECPRKFRTAFYLRKHVSNVHSPNFKYRCSHCPRKFVEAKKLHLHLAILHERNLNDEERQLISTLKRYPCEHCSFTTYSQKVIRNHVDSHTGNYPFKCTFCSKGYSYRYQLTQHVAMNHTAEGGQCDDCGRVFYNDTTFARHKAVHADNKGFTCEICKKVYESEGLWQRHVNDNHPTEPGSVSCEVCGKSFSLSTSLRLHKRVVHGRHKPPRRRFNTDLVCDICGVDFKFIGSLEAHKVVKHGDKKEGGQIVCPYCDKPSSSQLTLSLHMRLHFNEKPFKCKFCKREFTLLASCKAHEERHRVRKKFVCPHCDTEFLFQSRLNRHLQTYHVALYSDQAPEAEVPAPELVEAEDIPVQAVAWC